MRTDHHAQQWQPLASFDAISEANSFIDQATVMQPLKYALEGALDGDTAELRVEANLATRMTKDASRLPLLLSSDLSVTGAHVDGEACHVERVGDKLWLLPGRVCHSGSSLTCHLSFRGWLPSAYVLRETTGIWAELAPQAFWYPLAAELSSTPTPFTLSLQVPSGVVATSNGSLVDEKHTKTEASYSWTSGADARGIAVFAGNYAAQQRSRDNLTVRTFVYPDMTDHVDEIATMVDRIAGFYVERFGPSSAGEITVVVPPHSVGGNWALPRMIVAGQISPASDRPRRFGILAHETAHQWWAYTVRFDHDLDLWLMEGLTVLAELSARMRLEGEQATTAHLTEWTLPHYAVAREAKVPLAECRGDTPHSQELREDASAVFLALLRQRMGGAEFDRRLKAFFAAHAGRTATSAAFVETMTDGANKSLQEFVRGWLHNPRLPEVTSDEVLAGISGD